MREVNAVIADDEEQIRRHLKSRLRAIWPELTICAEAANGIDALTAVTTHGPQVVFLDIRMPGMSGMEVAARVGHRCHVVFITAYDQYAVEAFENAAIDFLLKPFSDDRLRQTVERLKKYLNAAQPDPERFARLIEAMAGSVRPEEKKYLQWLRVLSNDCIQIVPIDQVCYMMADNKYTTVVTREREHLIRKPIKELAEELDPERFWRIHRGTIVNVGCIDKVSRSLTGRLVLRLRDHEETLTVSRTYAALFRQM